jgi:saccharopine dehydrogenase-like NADP-dependent oxidoreductase
VTASYVSDEMKALNSAAIDKGVILLNEVGLDPGIDHMLIMKAVDSIQSRGGIVTEIISLCGGLPDPVAGDNPLKYKISWSPMGVLSGAKNRYEIYYLLSERRG